MSFNKIILVGNLGKDPELRYTPQGTAVCDFSMAVNERKRDKSGEYQDATTWFRVTTWRQMAENASKYLNKGSQVYIEGRLSVEEWTDRDGNNRYTLGVQATDMHFLGSGSRAAQGAGDSDNGVEFAGPASEPPTANDQARAATNDDDIPF